MRKFKDELLRGDSSVCIFGLGYIGFSALVYFAHKGIRCIGFDTSEDVIGKIGRGECPAPGLDSWIQTNGMSLKIPAVLASKIEDLYDHREDISVYKLCIPTEADGKASAKYLGSTCQEIAKIVEGSDKQVLVDIESTVAPSMLDEVVAPIFANMKNVLVASSPRRDWFISSEKDLRRIPRIVGGATPEAGEAARQVNSIVCDDVLVGSTHRVASATKAVENALRNVSINVVNEMARTLDIDVREVCNLVATKWNVGQYEPSIGIGGYCIPLGPAYLLEGEPNGKDLSFLNTAIAATKHHIQWVADKIQAKSYKKVAIVGLTYRGDVPVFKGSPPIDIAKSLAEGGTAVVVNDLYINDEFVKLLFDDTTIEHKSFPEVFEGAELVIVGGGHGGYRCVQIPELMKHLGECKELIDNEGVFMHVPADVWKENAIRYIRPGEKGWI